MDRLAAPFHLGCLLCLLTGSRASATQAVSVSLFKWLEDEFAAEVQRSLSTLITFYGLLVLGFLLFYLLHLDTKALAKVRRNIKDMNESLKSTIDFQKHRKFDEDEFHQFL